jgi:predicted dinucleotide-binding enzyme
MRIGIIGAGHIGGTLAKLFVDAGHEVAVSNSRGPETLASLVEQLGDGTRAMTAEDAGQFGEIVVVSMPFGHYGDVPAEAVVGKVVIDTNNYYPDRDGHIAELDDESTTTAQLLQEHLGSARVVKGFNNIYFRHLGALARPSGAADRSALAIAGDDEQAKTSVTAFLDDIGYDAVDLGPLAEGWRTQRDTAAYAGLYGSFDDPAGTPGDAASVRAAAARSRRYADSPG